MEASTTEIDWNRELVDQLDWHWKHHLRPRLENLSDHEYLWETVAGCWSLRPRGEAVSPMAAGADDVVADFEYPEPQPAPFTTIAWRMGHISVGVLGTRAANHFGEPGGVEYDSTEWPLTAAGGLMLHISREVIHHGSELCRMRDLYRTTAAGSTAVGETAGARS